MKEGIHPNYLPATVGCACGNVVVTRSTRGDFQVDVCAACHPFYTGTQKLIDAAGRVDRFRRRYGAGGAPKGGKPVVTPSEAPPAAEAAPAAEAPAEAAAEAPAAD